MPPETWRPHTLLPSRGASNCASRVMRLPPDTHLERHDQRLARRVPIEIDFGAIDRNARERIVEIDDDALVHQDLAVEHVRNAVGSDIGADARRAAADRVRTGSRPRAWRA